MLWLVVFAVNFPIRKMVSALRTHQGIHFEGIKYYFQIKIVQKNIKFSRPNSNNFHHPIHVEWRQKNNKNSTLCSECRANLSKKPNRNRGIKWNKTVTSSRMKETSTADRKVFTKNTVTNSIAWKHTIHKQFRSKHILPLHTSPQKASEWMQSLWKANANVRKRLAALHMTQKSPW